MSSPNLVRAISPADELKFMRKVNEPQKPLIIKTPDNRIGSIGPGTSRSTSDAISMQSEPNQVARRKEKKVMLFDAMRGEERLLVAAVSDFVSKHKVMFINTWIAGITIYTMITFEE